MLELNKIYNIDCMDLMKQFPDKYFELSVVDPPYGINVNNNMGRRKGNKKSDYPKAYWDTSTPDDTYFQELFRVSKNQIIFGGNYFRLPPTKCFIVWRKPHISENVSFAMVEYAWTSFDQSAKEWIGASNEKDRIHVTQKPVALYHWILSKFAKFGDKILDTHVGSASSLIACYDLGYDFIGAEIDKYYFEKASDRLYAVMSQTRLF